MYVCVYNMVVYNEFRELDLLVNITRVEYRILGPYLEEPCLYQEEIGGGDLRTRYRKVKKVNQTEPSR